MFSSADGLGLQSFWLKIQNIQKKEKPENLVKSRVSGFICGTPCENRTLN